MNDYVDKICPFCKTVFKETDDIVVCSDCDMPHHKDCWIENQGCTTFGCIGTIKAADGSLTTVTASALEYEDAVTPPARNNTNPYGYTTLQYSSYRQQTACNNVYSSTTSLDADVVRLIEIKSEYYRSEFQELKSQNEKTSWNWCAFLVTPYWLIYRKMYGYGVAVLAVDFVVSVIDSIFLSLLALAGGIVFGIFANYIYMTYLEGKANQVKSMTEPYRSQFIAQNSGVNSTATILAIIGYAVLVLIISL